MTRLSKGDNKPTSTTGLADNGIYLFSANFTPDTARDVIKWILESNLNKERNYDHLTLIINSPGGEVSSAFAIIDMMRGSALPVHTIGLGMIGSCGLLTFIAGAKGHRTLTPNTSILSHQWSWGSWGKEHELLAQVKEFDLTTKRVMAHYKVATGLDDETIRTKLLPPQDIWLSSDEAKELNLCDVVKDMNVV